MTLGKEPQYLAEVPFVLPARITIAHLQLRDILQPSSSKGKLLYLNQLKVDEVDFENPTSPPRTFCSLDFRANCLVTGYGLLAAGGQYSELAIRPLAAASRISSASPTTTASSYDGPRDSRLTAASEQRQPTPWVLRTPTGGSINNSVAIYPDPPSMAENKRGLISHINNRSSKSLKKEASFSPLHSRDISTEGVWSRDEPHDGHESIGGLSSHTLPPDEDEIEAETLAAAYGFEKKYWPSALPSATKRQEQSCPVTESANGELARRSFYGPGDTRQRRTSSLSPPTTVRVFCSNNDRSLKIYKLRPPSGASSSPALESGLPGISRSHTLDFPTAVNHCSFSPDGQTLLAVGDTPHVFVYHRNASTGAFSHVTTYASCSDASFSTSWHPDGTKFAVASQDGIVSVWDVRSSKKLAELKTSQSSVMLMTLGGMNGASGAARVVKFSPCGRYLAFTEHRLYFHIYDTLTYTRGQRIRIPTSLDAGNIETVNVVGGREADTTTAAPSLSAYVDARERIMDHFESRLLSSLYGQNGQIIEALLESARRDSQSLTSSLRLPLSSGNSSTANAPAIAASSESFSSPATGPNDSAVNALREARRSLRAVRERIAARSRNDGTGAGVGISGPFDPFVADAGLSLSGLEPNLSDGEEDMATIRRRSRQNTSGQEGDGSSQTTSLPRDREESGGVRLQSEAEFNDEEEDNDDADAHFSYYLRRRRDLSRILPRPNVGQSRDAPSSNYGDAPATMAARRSSWRLGTGTATETLPVARIRRWFPEGRLRSTEDQSARTLSAADVFENSVAEVLGEDIPGIALADDGVPNLDPNGEALLPAGGNVEGVAEGQEEEGEAGVVFLDDYRPPENGDTSATRPPSLLGATEPLTRLFQSDFDLDARAAALDLPPTMRMPPERRGAEVPDATASGRGPAEVAHSTPSSPPFRSFFTSTNVASGANGTALPPADSNSSGGTTPTSSVGTRMLPRFRMMRSSPPSEQVRQEGIGSIRRSDSDLDDLVNRVLYPSVLPRATRAGVEAEADSSLSRTTLTTSTTTAASQLPSAASSAVAQVRPVPTNTAPQSHHHFPPLRERRRSRSRRGAEAGLEEVEAEAGAQAQGEDLGHIEEAWLNISGLTWDPDGEYLYVSSERCVARYAVLLGDAQDVHSKGGRPVGGWEKGEIR